jgi:hypothetical protein
MAAADTVIQTAAPTILENFMVLPPSLTKSCRNACHVFDPLLFAERTKLVDKGNGLSPGPGLVDGFGEPDCVWLS